MSTETPEKPNTETKSTSAAGFRKQRLEASEGAEVVLLNGLTVVVKRPSINQLIASGYIPADVAAVLNVAQQSGQGSVQASTKQFAKMLELQRLVATEALVSPNVVAEDPDYDKDEVLIEDIDDVSLAEIMTYVQGGTAALQSFRNQRQSRSARPDMQEIPRPTPE